MTLLNRAALALISIGTLLGNTGCQSQVLPIGGGEPSPGNDGSSAAALLVARWDGYVENFQFRSGSDKVRIDIDAVEGSTIQGTVRFGAEPDVAPPTDPDVGYPPDPWKGPYDGPGYDFELPYEGFDFTLFDAQLTDRRLRFYVAPLELWKGWCELQTPRPLERPYFVDQYFCQANQSTSIGSDGCFLGGEPLECGYFSLCTAMICECDESACTVHAELWPQRVDFDVAFDQQDADGSMAIKDALFNVRLTRDP
ncbi:hypothetical protein [Sorangium sp. So ce131]|uniref:hypothetical protein n=1 Tax=Sorangium sp. So ce131 TaxID=3133282 RepID=UPI003F635BFD